MERWSGRVAAVTGASSGIGAAIVKELVKHGVVTVGLARRDEKIKELSKELQGCPGKLHAVKCDVSKEEDILAAFKWIKDNLGGADILVNNAGIFGETKITEAPTEEWRRQLDLNVLGLSICTREAVKNMRDRGVDDGHIVHISSIAGHTPPPMSEFSMYFATKTAVRVLTEGLRKDFQSRKSKMRVTEVSPGLVDTEIFNDKKTFNRAALIDVSPHLKAKDVADAVIYAIGAPPHVQVHEIIILPVGAQ